MKTSLEIITSGKAVGKQYVRVDGYGSFRVLYEQLYTECMMTLYLCHSLKMAEVKLCNTLFDVAQHLGVDCDELVNSLPDSWQAERKFNAFC